MAVNIPRVDDRKDGEIMPRRPKLPCRRSGCPELVEPGEGYCPKHKKENNRYIKQNRTDKDIAPFYDSKEWKRLRKLKLATNPLCEVCEREGRTTIATIVHHKEEIRKGGDYLPTLEELESVCLPCHSGIHGGFR